MELRTQLQHARRQRSSNEAHIVVRVYAGTGIRCIRHTKVDVIEGVIGFETQLQRGSLRDASRFEDRHIKVDHTWCAQLGVEAWSAAIGVCGWIGEGEVVEPPIFPQGVAGGILQ
jgi:hypothetical protein